ncbi:MAG: hypothetical protein AB1453_06250 [Chloroflexota bacterium]|jgi:hypothetical protein
MNKTASEHKSYVDWLTIVAIAAISISFTVAVHEGIHALTCVGVGSHLQEYSALYVSCDSPTTLQSKLVDGSAPTFNIIAGLLLLVIVRNTRKWSSEGWFFLWLFMLMNLLYGSGYWMFSGIANIGDMATVISGWQPAWLWRITLTIFGSLLFMFFVWLALQEFSKVIGGNANEQIRRANKLSIISYATSCVVVLMAGLFSPLGLLSLPVTAGLLAVSGGLSPLLWMMQWFRAKMFIKVDKPPLEIHRKWQWIVSAGVVVVFYVFILGRTIYF